MARHASRRNTRIPRWNVGLLFFKLPSFTKRNKAPAIPNILHQITIRGVPSDLFDDQNSTDTGISSWLIHPRTNPTASKPLVRRYRTNSGLWYPVITPQLEGGRRNPSVSSMSSQASSQGGHTTPSSLGSIGSSGTHPQVFAAYDLVISVPAVVDTTSGAILPPDTASTHLAAPPLDDSSRYQIYLHISNTGAYSPQSPSHIAPRPRLEHRTERRTIIIRELNFDVTEQGLQGLLVAQNLAGLSSFYITRPENRRCHALVTFTTCPDAREAVRRLHNRRFMDRILKVDLAQEPSPVDVKRPIIADGSI